MSYKYCADQLKTTLKLLTNYNDTNITQGDYRVLQRGFDKAIVLRPGTFSHERTEFSGGADTTWNIVTELFIKYKDDAQVNNDIRDERQNIMDKVDQYPFLNTAGTSTIFFAIMTSGNEPAPVFGQDGSGPHYLLQEMTCKVQEHITITDAE